MNEPTRFLPFFAEQGERAFHIAGPCSAESREQVLTTARLLQGAQIDLFRAGVWKPRTMPGNFEGVGAPALAWLQEVQATTGMKVATEVATPTHAEAALKAGIDVLWLGARTVANPFAVQEVADALRGSGVPVMVKNPINPDLKLWLGAIERLARAGVKHLAAIHRGFSTYGEGTYRNPPMWQLPIELKRIHPDLALICDPSHIAGKRDTLESIAQQSLDLGYDGIHLEVHPQPDRALSDPMQQVTPAKYTDLKGRLVFRKARANGKIYTALLENLRDRIDLLDDELMDVLEKRMNLAGEIGAIKRETNTALYQPQRWNDIIDRCMRRGQQGGLGVSFLSGLLKTIHEESIRRQSEMLYDKTAPQPKK